MDGEVNLGKGLLLLDGADSIVNLLTSKLISHGRPRADAVFVLHFQLAGAKRMRRRRTRAERLDDKRRWGGRGKDASALKRYYTVRGRPRRKLKSLSAGDCLEPWLFAVGVSSKMPDLREAGRAEYDFELGGGSRKRPFRASGTQKQ